MSKSELLGQTKLYLSKKNHVPRVPDASETPMQEITTIRSSFDTIGGSVSIISQMGKIVIPNFHTRMSSTTLSTTRSLDLLCSTLLPLDNGVVLTQLPLLFHSPLQQRLRDMVLKKKKKKKKKRLESRMRRELRIQQLDNTLVVPISFKLPSSLQILSLYITYLFSLNFAMLVISFIKNQHIKQMEKFSHKWGRMVKMHGYISGWV